MRVCSHCHLHVGEGGHPPCGAVVEDVRAHEPSTELAAMFTKRLPFSCGTSGTLYRVVRAGTGQRGLLKVLPSTGIGLSADRMRYKRELLRQVSVSCGGLARVFEAGESTSGQLWLFRELVEGESLATRLARSGPLSTDDALCVVVQLAQGLEELHRHGLLHRDVKPLHVVVRDRSGAGMRAVLVDAGLSLAVDAGGSRFRGSPGFCAPEQAAGEPTGFRSDLYSLGCVFYAMVTGTALASSVHGSGPAGVEAALADLAVPLPGPARDLLASLLAQDARRRPFSAQQVKRVLEPLLRVPLPQERAEGDAPALDKAAELTQGDRTYELKLEDLESDNMALPADAGAGTERSAEWLHTRELERLKIAAGDPQADGSAEWLHTQELARLKLAAEAPRPGQPDAAQARGAEVAGGPFGEFDVDALFQEVVPESAEQQATVDGAQPLVTFPGEPGDEEITAKASTEEAPGWAPPTTPAPIADESPAVLPVAAGGAAEDGVAAEQRTEDTQSAQTPVSVAPQTAEGLWTMDRTVRRVGWGLGLGALGLAVLWIAQGRSSDSAEALAVGDSTAQVVSAHSVANAALAEEPDGEGAGAAAVSPGVHPEVKAASAAGAALANSATPGGQVEPQQVTGQTLAQASEEVLTFSPEEVVVDPEQGDPAQTGEPGESAHSGRGARVKARALALYTAGRFRAAARAYRRATVLEPLDAGAHAGLGAALLAMGNRAQAAVAAYREAVRLQPETSGYHAALGRAYYHAGDRRTARESYQRALALDPNNRAATAALAKLQLAARR